MNRQRGQYRPNNRHAGNNRPRPNYRGQRRSGYQRRKRQASSAEAYFTIIVLGIGAVLALASRVSSGALAGALVAVLLVLAIGAAAWFWRAFWRGQRFRAVRIAGVDQMDGFVFEKYVAELLRHQGFQHVQLTEKYDLGIDAIAERDDERWGIQIKRNRDKTKALSVRQAVTALNHYRCTRAMVVSNNYFTGSAKQLATSNRCVLIDRDKLSEWILAYQRR